MDLLVAYGDDPAGMGLARGVAGTAPERGRITPCGGFDLLVTGTPAISADWLDTGHDSYIFLSKHAAASGIPALTCHSTGNFAEAAAGGSERQVAVPYPSFQKRYMQALDAKRESFGGFDITIEATHHGPTGLDRPCIFVEVGTTPEQWNDEALCASVAEVVLEAVRAPEEPVPFGVCFGGTHYSSKFTRELLHGRFGLGTVIPKHALGQLDEELFAHVMDRNRGATAALVDWTGLGPHKQKVMDLISGTDLEPVRL